MSAIRMQQHNSGGDSGSGGGDHRLIFLLFLLFSSISAGAAGAPPPEPSISYPLSSAEGVPTLTIYVGSPPLPFTVSLQTASDLSWLPCPSNSTFTAVPCVSPDLCFSTPFVAAPFPPSTCRSLSDPCRFRSSAIPLPFNIDLFSFDISTILFGHISLDDFYFSSNHLPPTNATFRRPIAFGCATSARTAAGPPSPPPPMGGLGLSPSHYSFASQFLRNDPSNSSAQQRFAYCLSGGNATSSNVSAAGALHLGAYKLPPASLLEELSYSRFQYPRSTSTDTRYYAMIESIEIDDGETAPFVIDPSAAAPSGQDLPVHLGTFDTGSPYTKLPSQIYAPLFRELARRTSVTNPMGVSDGVGNALCYSGHLSQVTAIFPRVRLRFHGGAVLETGAESLLETSAGGGSDGADPIYCLSIRDAGQNSGNITVIGRHQQRDHWIEFDLLGRRVGIAKANCSQAL